MRREHAATLFFWLGLATACGDDAAPPAVSAGGAMTVYDRSSNAYSMPSPNLSDAELERHFAGDVAFEAAFVTAPATVNAGLGPQFNNNACISCHRRDGRGLAQFGAGASQALVRVSLPTGIPGVPGGAVEVPGFGAQLQDHAVFGASAEVEITLAWESVHGEFGDGATFELRRPPVTITGTGQPLPSEALTSLRIGPAVFGLGLLASIPEADLLRAQDELDADSDGISGRVNRVWDPQRGVTALGRFGHKANTVDLHVQTAAAYVNDMGVASPLFPGPSAEEEISDDTVAASAFYVSTLGVPERTLAIDGASQGEQLFTDFGCASCHAPTQRTLAAATPALENQTFRPYTDLLLHDMGEGLADGRPDFAATGTEWRTPPLWGLGLVETVLPGGTYLHDGRARSISEAILWHGGEAQAAKERYRLASSSEREQLLAFLRSL